MLFQQHLALFALLLKGEHNAFAERLRDGSVRLGSFAQFIAEHRLQLFVWSQLESSPARQLLPRQWLEQLKAFSVTRWAAQERLIRELIRLSSLLAAAGHECIVLKGPYLAERFFGGIDRREFYDLDILIKREDLRAVERLLCNSGYVRKSSVLLGRPLTAYFTHSLDFVGQNFGVDLHWKFSAQFRHRLDYDAIWHEKRSFRIRGDNFMVLSDEHEIMFHLISIFKELEMGMARLRAFVDLYFVLEQIGNDVDWELFLEHRQCERIRNASLTVLALLLQFFDCSDRFSELTAIVARDQGHFMAVSVKDHQALMETLPGAAWNRVWASKAYDCPRLTLLLWWIASWPFRLAVHQPEKYDRFRRRLQQATARFRST